MKQLLLIDDDKLEHKMFRCYLSGQGASNVHLDHAENLVTAIDILRKVKTDWVFLDDRCSPYRSAMETLPLLRPYLNSARVIVISSSTYAKHLQCAESLGVHAIIDKFELKNLLKGDIMSLEASLRATRTSSGRPQLRKVV